MLVLTEKCRGEGIELSLPPGFVVPDTGLTVDVNVLRVAGSNARIGFEADRSVRIVRKSLKDRDGQE